MNSYREFQKNDIWGFPGDTFSHHKVRKNNIYCTRMVLNEITYIMNALVGIRFSSHPFS